MSAPTQTLTAVPGIRVGHWSDTEAATGCTVVLLPPEGAVGGVEVRGAAPGTRETDLLRPGTLVRRVHAILLSGGSAFGLEAASGVMRFLEEAGIGFPTRAGVVPIVPAAVLFDLALGRADVRPGRAEGYTACQAASAAPVPQGSVGAGTGATVGKALGMERAVKGGLGSVARRLQEGHVVAALMAVNAFGDILDPETAEVLAGPRRTPAGQDFEDTREVLLRGLAPPVAVGGNTTIGVIATDVPLTVEEANRLAIMAHSGIARAVRPSYGMGDGDTLFVLSTAPEPSRSGTFNLTALGAAAAWTVERSIVNAIQTARGLAGVPAASELASSARYRSDQ
ncbi:MAG: P1 family peptidase [Chloroflexi bacterium]|nr:P1 family peptidase [Chloroflexota bacterium]